ncbi:hypothetical protein TanjilG_32692 [Lupinus angustifolius]|uniref:Uncharacterized protein n=1 Tax=Lupinus angustifolius TaxID=3871 RepID=A0A1J7H5F5_LUPAN|nr:hypothetical protein TanjilG_32692 [Lupinus angustifolius]
MEEVHDAMVSDPALSSPPLPPVTLFYYSQERQFLVTVLNFLYAFNSIFYGPGMIVMMGLKKKDEVL